MMNNEEKETSNKIDTEEFFERYKINWTEMLSSYKTKDENDDIYEQVDLALYNLLCEFKDKLPPLDENFHAVFRKYPSIGEGVDSAIWHLLNVSKLFWNTINSFYEEEKEKFEFGDKVMAKDDDTDWIKATFIKYKPNNNIYRFRVCTPHGILGCQHCRKGWDE